MFVVSIANPLSPSSLTMMPSQQVDVSSDDQLDDSVQVECRWIPTLLAAPRGRWTTCISSGTDEVLPVSTLDGGHFGG